MHMTAIMRRLGAASLLLIYASSAHAASLFGSNETYSANLNIFPKWTKVVAQHGADPAAIGQQCQAAGCSKQKWDRFIADTSKLSRTEQVAAVNRFHNQHPYIEDIINWGVRDYWATVPEFFAKNGDCEDYAISKFISLKRLGFAASSMRIVVLKDMNLGVMHSVLAVYEGGTIFILDNQIKQVVEHTAIHHYNPIYSINETGWWRHRQ